MNKNIKLTKSAIREFEPITYSLEFTVNSQEELNELKNEFTEGLLDDLYTDYSILMYDILTVFKNEFS